MMIWLLSLGRGHSVKVDFSWELELIGMLWTPFIRQDDEQLDAHRFFFSYT